MAIVHDFCPLHLSLHSHKKESSSSSLHSVSELHLLLLETIASKISLCPAYVVSEGHIALNLPTTQALRACLSFFRSISRDGRFSRLTVLLPICHKRRAEFGEFLVPISHFPPFKPCAPVTMKVAKLLNCSFGTFIIRTQ